jgi:vacuolar-type H+-ATPase subunit F/Vma7
MDEDDLIPKPTTPSVHFNDKINEYTDMLFEPDENDMYIVHLNDVHYEDIDNTNDVYINAHDITIIRIIKENFDEGTDFKEMMRSILGNDIAFLDPNLFI